MIINNHVAELTINDKYSLGSLFRVKSEPNKLLTVCWSILIHTELSIPDNTNLPLDDKVCS